jgi:DNA-binding LacI/PurR family transcriptional regulator
MATEHPSLRELARRLKISHTTISDALRGSPKVNAVTRERILRAAENAGYRRNPLAGALMSEMRRSRTHDFRCTIAILDLRDTVPRLPGSDQFHAALVSGAQERAAQLGFEAKVFVFTPATFSPEALERTFEQHGVRGVVVLPFCGGFDFGGIPWHRYASVYLDYLIQEPQLNSLCSDHYRSMFTALEHLEALGYTRPGLMLQSFHDERLLFRCTAAFNAYHSLHQRTLKVPPLIVTRLTEADFKKWFERHSPDVVLAHRTTDVLTWMHHCGASVPDTHGFCCLNVTMNEVPCAGVDLQPALLGAQGTEHVVAALYQNRYGIPEIPSVTSIPARWVDGPTLIARTAEMIPAHAGR